MKEFIPFKPRHLPSWSSIFESPAEPPEISCTFSYTQHGVVLMEISGRVFMFEIVNRRTDGGTDRRTKASSLRERLHIHKVFTKDKYVYLNYHKFSIKSYVLDV